MRLLVLNNRINSSNTNETSIIDGDEVDNCTIDYTIKSSKQQTTEFSKQKIDLDNCLLWLKHQRFDRSIETNSNNSDSHKHNKCKTINHREQQSKTNENNDEKYYDCIEKNTVEKIVQLFELISTNNNNNDKNVIIKKQQHQTLKIQKWKKCQHLQSNVDNNHDCENNEINDQTKNYANIIDDVDGNNNNINTNGSTTQAKIEKSNQIGQSENDIMNDNCLIENNRNGEQQESTTSLHRLQNLFQNMINELEIDNSNINEFIDFNDEQSLETTAAIETKEENEIIKSTKHRQKKRQKCIIISVYVYHRSATRGHRIGRKYHVKSKFVGKFLQKIKPVRRWQRKVDLNQPIINETSDNNDIDQIIDTQNDQISSIENNHNEINIKHRFHRSKSTCDAFNSHNLMSFGEGKLNQLNRPNSLLFYNDETDYNDNIYYDINRKIVEEEDENLKEKRNDNNHLMNNVNLLNVERRPSKLSRQTRIIHKRRESLDEYFMRKVFNDIRIEDYKTINAYDFQQLKCLSNKRIVDFKANNPWYTFVRSHECDIDISKLSNDEIQMYESVFEIVISEKIYTKELEISIEKAKKIVEKLSEYPQKKLLGNLSSIYAINSILYNEFCHSFKKDFLMHNLFNILKEHLKEKFEPYIIYLKGQHEREKILADDQLLTMDEKKNISEIIITPMQRITRYPLLLKNTLNSLEKYQQKTNDDSLNQVRKNCEECFMMAKNFSMRCDQAINEQMNLQKLIEFRKKILNKFEDNFVRIGRLIEMESSIKIIKHITMTTNEEVKDQKQRNAMLILLTDLLMLMKKSNKDEYKLIDYDYLDRVVLTPGAFVKNENSNNEEKYEYLRKKSLTATPAIVNMLKFVKDNRTELYQFEFIDSNELNEFVKKFKILKSNHLSAIKQQFDDSFDINAINNNNNHNEMSNKIKLRATKSVNEFEKNDSYLNVKENYRKSYE